MGASEPQNGSAPATARAFVRGDLLALLPENGWGTARTEPDDARVARRCIEWTYAAQAREDFRGLTNEGLRLLLPGHDRSPLEGCRYPLTRVVPAINFKTPLFIKLGRIGNNERFACCRRNRRRVAVCRVVGPSFQPSFHWDRPLFAQKMCVNAHVRYEFVWRIRQCGERRLIYLVFGVDTSPILNERGLVTVMALRSSVKTTTR